MKRWDKIADGKHIKGGLSNFRRLKKKISARLRCVFEKKYCFWLSLTFLEQGNYPDFMFLEAIKSQRIVHTKWFKFIFIRSLLVSYTSFFINLSGIKGTCRIYHWNSSSVDKMIQWLKCWVGNCILNWISFSVI